MGKVENITFTDKDAKVISYEEATGAEPGEDGKPKRAKIPKTENVYGSSAGASSGEFHLFRNLRRKEQFRLAKMDREATLEEKAKEFADKLELNRLEAEEKTAKNAAKRKRKQEAKKEGKKKQKVGGEDDGAIDGLIAAEPEKANAFEADGSFLEEALKKLEEDKKMPKWKKKS